MKTIVVGYDGTPAAELALARAAQLAGAFGSRVVVANVQPLAEPAVDVPIGAFGLAPFPYVGDVVDDDDDRWRQHREHVREFLAGRGIAHEFAGVVGRPGEEIVEVADARGADLIVVGTHEPGFLERLVAGSVSGDVVRRARCDVLIVHPGRARA